MSYAFFTGRKSSEESELGNPKQSQNGFAYIKVVPTNLKESQQLKQRKESNKIIAKSNANIEH